MFGRCSTKIPHERQTPCTERDGLAKQVPDAASPEEERIQRDLQTRRDALNQAQHQTALDKQKLQKIRDIRKRVTAFTSQMTRFYTEIEAQLREISMPDSDFPAFRPQFTGDTAAPLARQEAAIQQQIVTHEGDPEKPAVGTIRWLQQQIQQLEARQTADKVRQERVKAIQTRISAIATEIERINVEIAQIEGPEKERIAEVRRDRRAAYVAFFENLKAEQATLEELYAPVSAHLRSEAAFEHEQDLEFSIRWVADLEGWLERGSVLFDQRKTIPYGTMHGMVEAARRILAPAWTSGDPDRVGPAMTEFLAEFKKPELLPPAKYLRSGVSETDLLQWLYEVDHISLSYGLKYNGTELQKLSPGTKGIVLLILYLGMDVADSRPLIVDQPDENLDNESIYKLLTSYFRMAKKRRQIILITHNPNLVVNSDAEQVIVAHCQRRENGFPHITYESGALENVGSEREGIRQQVCRILEGGSDAFLKREKRYALLEA